MNSALLLIQYAAEKTLLVPLIFGSINEGTIPTMWKIANINLKMGLKDRVRR